MAFYLKYRPKLVSEIDNGYVREQFPAFFSKRDFPHAFLFTGPKGIGKTSTARIIAKVINCQKGVSSKKVWEFTEPCNKCDQCLTITKGSNMDVLEIDAASNRGIDEIRELREKIGYLPTSATYKVYIIDEVHMLTTEAFNALLKTLEEPPVHAIFILCTTERHKIPDTIASRCINVAFSEATKEELKRSLSRIIKGEKLDIDEEAFDLISDRAEGSFRDGVKILEHVSSVKKGRITLENVKEVLFLNHINEKLIINSIIDKNAKEAIKLIKSSIEKGVDPKILTKIILQKLQKLLIADVEGKKNDKLTFNDLKLLINLITKASLDLKYSPIAELPLELAIVDFCYT